VLAVERRPDGRGERLWHIRAKRVIVATGAVERPLVFRNNDRPGIMLAASAAFYARHFGVAPGRRAVVFANNDTAYDAAITLARAGVDIAAIVDTRRAASPRAAATELAGIDVRRGHAVVETDGDLALAGVSIARLRPDGLFDGDPERLECDFLAVSGGWN